MKKSFKTEQFIIIFNSLILIAGFAALMFLNKNQLKEIAIDQHAQSMKVFSSVLEKAISQQTLKQVQGDIVRHSELVSESLDSIIKNLAGENLNFRISLIDKDGRVVADSGTENFSSLGNHLDRPEIFAALSGKESIAIRQSSVNNNDELYFATPLVLQGENFALRLSAPIDSNIFFTGNYLFKMIFGTALILIMILFFSILISAHVIIGIDELKTAARHYQKEDFEFESTVTSPRELAELSATMNSMSKTIGKNIARLKELEQVRKDFVANVSHELKTPITSIKGFSETLLDGAIDDVEAARNFVGIIKTQSDRLENIIEDLLALSKLENENFSLELEETDVIELVKNLCDEYKSVAEKKQIAVSFSSTQKSCIKKISPRLFYQALANIFDNAVKYCPTNSAIDCSCQCEQSRLVITIEDSGNGIPEEYEARIFERFFRVDKGRSRETGGTGLGLSITKHIVELHSGTIREYKSPHYKSGACFEITL